MDRLQHLMGVLRKGARITKKLHGSWTVTFPWRLGSGFEHERNKDQWARAQKVELEDTLCKDEEREVLYSIIDFVIQSRTKVNFFKEIIHRYLSIWYPKRQLSSSSFVNNNNKRWMKLTRQLLIKHWFCRVSCDRDGV